MDYVKDEIFRKIGEWSSLIDSSVGFVDMVDAFDEFIVKVDIAGVEKKNIFVKPIGDHLLLVKATREKEDNKEWRYVEEGRAKRICKKIFIPRDVEMDGAEASLDRGVLTIKLPKKKGIEKKEKPEEESKGVRISVS